jgi:hypothetical protein
MEKYIINNFVLNQIAARLLSCRSPFLKTWAVRIILLLVLTICGIESLCRTMLRRPRLN